MSVPWVQESVFIVIGSVVPLFGGIAALVFFAHLVPARSPLSLWLHGPLFLIGAAVAAAPLFWLYGRYSRLIVK